MADETPDGFWGKTPVIIRYQKFFAEHWEWHRRQVLDALNEMNDRYPEGIAIIPSKGFHIDAVRAITEQRDGVLKYSFGVGLNEDTHPGRHVPTQIAFARSIKRDDLSDIGTDFNPFLQFFPDLAADTEKSWPDYLKWRRRQPWKPVPQWLLELRARPRRREKTVSANPS